MLEDYYAILGVSPAADLASIRAAYRQKASRCHPDHGGSHAEMVRINEAWAVLSDPALRNRYDESRRQPDSQTARSFTENDAPYARQQAAEYPKDWNQFEDWLDVVSADFSRAKFGKVDGGVFGTVWPTASQSLSATLFLWGGGIVGVVVLLVLFACSPAQWTIGNTGRILGMGSFIFACGGAWVGYWLHGLCREVLKTGPAPARRSPKSAPPPQTFVVRCPHCGQQLRLPRSLQPLAVKCGRCRHGFDLPPSVVS